MVFEDVAPAMATRSSPVGGAGTRIFQGVLEDLDPNYEVRGTRWYGNGSQLGFADQMMRDGHVRSSVSYITDPIMAAIWAFKPASKSDIDREIADACAWAFLERLDWGETLEKIFKYFTHGVSVLEMTDDMRPIPQSRFPLHPGRGVGVVPTGFHQRLASTIRRWNQSTIDPTKLASVEQYIPGSDTEKAGSRVIPGDRLLRWTWDQDGANFTGFAPLRSCFGAWKTKQLLWVIEGMRHERQALGIPVLSEPENPSDEDLERAATALAAIRAHEKGYMQLPHGYTLEWSTTAAGTGTNIRETIECCNRDIAINSKAGFMLLGQTTSQNGSYALANTQEGQYQIGLVRHAAFVCRVMNRGSDGWSPVERFVRLNYGNEVQLPRLVARNLPTTDWSKIATTLASLVEKNVITVDDDLEFYMREALNLPPHDPNTARKKPEPKLFGAPPPADKVEPTDPKKEEDA